MTKPVWTSGQIIDQLDSGYHWSGQNLTYGFPSSASWFPFDEKTGFSALNSTQQVAATLTVKLWDDLISPDFTFAADGATANVKYMNTTTNIGYAHAYYPSGWQGGGSIWFNSAYGTSSGTNNLMSPAGGAWGWAAYVHETGHALGLDHPGEYHGGSPTYANDALYAQDSQMYTIMSYFTAAETGADWRASDGRTYYAQTPMIHDIMAIEAIYGAETTTRTGDTTYGFNSTADAWLYDFTQNRHPVLCIYDSAGHDTIDFSGWSFSCVINLAPGSFSSCDMMTYNISIAEGVQIENGTGGAGADAITGNELGNHLFGLAGSDVLDGAGGDDFLDGGLGADTLCGAQGNDKYYVDNVGDNVFEATCGGTDTVYVTTAISYTLQAGAEVEVLRATSSTSTYAVNLTGNEFGQTLIGNAAANVLDGKGGSDKLYGYGGDDTYYVDGAGDRAYEATSGGADTVIVTTPISYALLAGQEIETLRTSDPASTYAANLYGNEFAQTLAGNAAANVLDGRGGADQMYGHGGNDKYCVDNVGDKVFEAALGGTDTVYVTAAMSYALQAGAEVEGLVVKDPASTLAVNLTGNEFKQTLAGNAAANILDGKGGTDKLYGFGGADTFCFSTALVGGNVDTIADFNVADDTIQLSRSVFSALSAGTLADSAFTIGAAATDSLDRIVYNAANGALFYDADGSGVGAAVQFAALTPGLALTYNDFIIMA